MNSILKAALASLLFTTSIFAQEAPKAIETVDEATNTKEVTADKPLDITSTASEKVVKTEEKKEALPDQVPLPASEPATPLVKNVYISVALGSGKIKYGGSDTNFDQNATNVYGDHSVLTFETGLYFPIPSQKLLVGPSIAIVSDEYGDENADHLYMESYLLGLSAIKYFEKSPIGGAYLRGDLGLAWQSGEVSYNDGEQILTHESGMGYGYLVGAGYVFGSGSIGFKVEANLQTHVIEDSNINSVTHSSTFNFGILF